MAEMHKKIIVAKVHLKVKIQAKTKVLVSKIGQINEESNPARKTCLAFSAEKR